MYHRTRAIMDASLCFGFLKSGWQNLKKRLEDGDENAWSEAIGVFERRMRERFFSSIDALVAADTKPDLAPQTPGQIEPCIPGFSILARPIHDGGTCWLFLYELAQFKRTLVHTHVSPTL